MSGSKPPKPPKATRKNIYLSPELYKLSEKQLRKRHFDNFNEYVRHLIREDVNST